jgi:hypothetical protein
MILEQIRENVPVGAFGLFSNQYPILLNRPLPLLFHEYSNTAFHFTVSALREFENEKIVANNRYLFPSVIFWFLSLESYISTLFKVSLLKAGISEDEWKKEQNESLRYKFSRIHINLFNKKNPNRGHFSPLIEEFCIYRNSLFHDAYFFQVNNYEKTFFSKIPDHSNEIDLMQSLLITLDSMFFYKNSLTGLNLMPNILIGERWIRLDTLFESYIQPTFQQICVKKGVETHINFSPRKLKTRNSCNCGFILVVNSEGLTYEKSFEYTNITEKNYQQLIKPIEDKTTFLLPDYTDNYKS